MSRYTKNIHNKFIKKLSKSNILIRLTIYGFVECGNIINFLSNVCDDETLEIPALRYIHSKIAECLKNHASDLSRFGNADTVYYFHDLKSLKDELEFVISVNHG